MPSIEAKSSIALELAPLWDSSATGPGSVGSPGTEVTGMRSTKLANPSMFGPSSAMSSDRAWATSSACAARPASPASPYPEDRTTALRMPAAAASESASSIPACGTIRNATSTGTPMSAHDVTVARPCVSTPRRLTRWVCSSNPNSTRLR